MSAGVAVNATHLEVLQANDAFYQAFLKGDADALVGMLSDRNDLEVMHPGWPTVRGRDLVTATWRDVAMNPPPLRVVAPRVLMLGPDAAIVTCYEHVERTTLVATNVWLRETGRWRLLHHQGAPSVRDEDAAVAPPDDLFH